MWKGGGEEAETPTLSEPEKDLGTGRHRTVTTPSIVYYSRDTSVIAGTHLVRGGWRGEGKG